MKTKSLNTGTDNLCYAGQWILETDENSLDNIPKKFKAPIKEIRRKTIVESAKVAERCQRNFDLTSPVPANDIQTIINACTTMPSKQNIAYYELIVSTDLAFNRACYNVAIEPTDDTFQGGRATSHQNGQVIAPLLLIYLRRPIDVMIETYIKTNNVQIDDPHNDRYKSTEDLILEVKCQFPMSVGISSGTASFSAAMLGYKTGFCGCVDSPALISLLATKMQLPIDAFPVPEDLFPLLLGIGKPTEHDRKLVIVDGKIVMEVDTTDKEVPVRYI